MPSEKFVNSGKLNAFLFLLMSIFDGIGKSFSKSYQ
ncbi:MAG: hypothetical protein CM1200mP33_4690 [Chloroflexota bacterium]|nr:MAG: hypothetical protein CM1200mP33_4690 [Chloroflexota bacterium]